MIIINHYYYLLFINSIYYNKKYSKRYFITIKKWNYKNTYKFKKKIISNNIMF